MQRSFAPYVLLLLGLTLAARAAKPPADAGANDPADFPRPPGLVRQSYSRTPGAIRDTEIATYHAEAGMDEVAGAYLERLQTANWKKGSDSTSGTDIHRVRIIEWTMPAKEAEVRFYALKGSGSDVRVRIFTYKTVSAPATATQGKNAITPVAATPAKQTAANASALSKATGATKLGPPPTNLTITAQSVLDHTLTWSSPPYTYIVAYREDSRDSSGWSELESTSGQSATEHFLVSPNTRYRVKVGYPDGSEGSAEYVWANPPRFQATLSPAQGHNGTPIKITHNFGFNNGWSVQFVPPPGTLAGVPAVNIEYWDATSATVRLENVLPVRDFDGTLVVTPPSPEEYGPALRLPFRWAPEYETQVMTLEETCLNSFDNPAPTLPGTPELPEYLKHLVATTDSHLTGPGQQLNVDRVTYSFPFLLGGKGDDEFFTQELLQKEWTVESVKITSWAGLGKGEAKVVDSRIGTNSPYVKVHWWANPLSEINYSLKITIKGPEGGHPLNWKTLPSR